ncbi:MAG: hypothetical protein PHS14_02925 [Elusimicrobia bacterium]|nr:hypothetical protein [Elusimicrobiota bacterium]
MAITVSDEFKAIWEEKQGTTLHQRIGYKRRYKLAGSYFTEAAWTYLYEGEFASIGTIPQQGDVRNNIIKTSVVTLKMPNENNQWIEHAGSPSFYASDAVATDGYKATRTLWQIQEGYELADGTIEWISVFTGVQLKKPKITGKSEYASIEVCSNAVLLDKADAEDVSEEPGLEDCIPPTGDGANTAFESTSTGVDHAKLFEVNGANLTQGSAWRVGNDNEVASAGNTGRLAIVAAAAPGLGQTVKTSVKRWLRDQLVETLQGLLADVAGVTSAFRSIAAVIFPGGLSGSKTIDSQVNWEAGTVLTDIDTTTYPGSISGPWRRAHDFTDADRNVGLGGISASDADGTFSYGAQDSGVFNYGFWSYPVAGTTGSRRFIHTVTSEKAAAAGIAGLLVVPFCDAPSGTSKIKGYALRWNIFNNKIEFVRFDDVEPNSSTTGTVLATIQTGHDVGSPVNWNVTRAAGGAFVIYKNGVSVATASDNTYTASDRFKIGVWVEQEAAHPYAYGSISKVGSSTLTGPTYTAIFESEVQDILSAPIAWGVLERTEVLNGGTIDYATTVCTTAGGVYDVYVDISAAGIIQSALKRYFKIRAEMTQEMTVHDSPRVEMLVARFSTSQIFVSLANHRAKTVLQQIEQYVKLANYELRFRGDGTMMIGPKTTAPYVVHLTQENGIVDVTEVDYGIPDRVIRGARVRYQGFVSEYGDVEAGATAETIADGDELGRKISDESLEDILVANDINLGYSRARVIYDSSRRSATDPRPPVRMRLIIWDVPWLEVSDVVRVDFYDHPLLMTLQANDELLRADSPYLHAGAPGNVISASKDWRVLYYNPNKDTRQAEIFVEEVL